MLLPTTQEEFNHLVELKMREDFGYEPTTEEKEQWLLGLMNLCDQVLESK